MSGNLFGIEANTNIAALMNQIQTNVQTTCDDGNMANNQVANATFNISNLSCSDIDLVIQKINSKPSCASSETLDAVSKMVAQQVAGTSAAVGTWNGSLIAFGANINTNVTDTQNYIQTKLSQLCGNDDPQQNSIKNVTVNMSGVTCDQLNFFTQNTSNQSLCMLQGYQTLQDDNKVLQQAGTVSQPVPYGTILLIVAILGGLAILAMTINGVLSKPKPADPADAQDSQQSPPSTPTPSSPT